MGKTSTGPAIRRRRSGNKVLAAYGHHPRKAIRFASMLFVLITIGLFVLARTGLREGWGIALLLIGMPGVLVAAYIRDLLLRGPLVIATLEGLIDRRRSADPIRWENIAEAQAKNRLFAKGVRLVLTDGERIEMDLSLLDAEPKDILHLIHSSAGADA